MLHELEVEPLESTSTVRLGLKWSDVKRGELLKLCVCNERGVHRIVGEGKVEGTWVGPFMDLPARLIANEHEVSSRNYTGLFNSMRKAYGDMFFEGSQVTVLQYRRIT